MYRKRSYSGTSIANQQHQLRKCCLISGKLLRSPMDFFKNPVTILSIVSVILVMLLQAHQTLLSFTDHSDIQHLDVYKDLAVLHDGSTSSAVDAATSAVLHHFRLYTSLLLIDDDLGFWVRPRSTTWFTKFLLEEYDDSRWIQMFRMTKRALLTLTHILAPFVQKQNTKYRLVVLVTVRIACTLFKLSHGENLLICSELFAVERSTVSTMLRDVVHAVNIVLKQEMTWPQQDTLPSIASGFQILCGLPEVLGAIDETHVAIKKPQTRASDYYYFKSGDYTIQCQAVVDSDKRFLDMYVGMPSSTNDARVLRRSTLFYQGQHRCLWEPNFSSAGCVPYLLGDGGYSLLPWLMVPHTQFGTLSPGDRAVNRKLNKGRVVVENAFGYLKRTFRELLVKTDLDIAFVPDVVICCILLHNVLLQAPALT